MGRLCVFYASRIESRAGELRCNDAVGGAEYFSGDILEARNKLGCEKNRSLAPDKMGLGKAQLSRRLGFEVGRRRVYRGQTPAKVGNVS